MEDYSEPLQVDHINGDRSDSRLTNLRMANQTYNNGNARKLAKSSSKYKGVTYHKRDRKYIARISQYGKQCQIGYFDNEIDAALAYDKAAVNLYGEYAMTNKRMGLFEQEGNDE